MIRKKNEENIVKINEIKGDNHLFYMNSFNLEKII